MVVKGELTEDDGQIAPCAVKKLRGTFIKFWLDIRKIFLLTVIFERNLSKISQKIVGARNCAILIVFVMSLSL